MTPPLPLDEVDQATTPAHFTRFVNFLDLCALALPNGFTGDGAADCRCRSSAAATTRRRRLRIGWAYQNATDYHRRFPPE